MIYSTENFMLTTNTIHLSKYFWLNKRKPIQVVLEINQHHHQNLHLLCDKKKYFHHVLLQEGNCASTFFDKFSLKLQYRAFKDV